jgi:hypothetical protein
VEGLSIEDADALEVIFQGVVASCEIPQPLTLSQNIQLAHCAVVHIASSNFVRTREKVEEDFGKYYKRSLPPPDTMSFGQAYRDFFWPYKV